MGKPKQIPEPRRLMSDEDILKMYAAFAVSERQATIDLASLAQVALNNPRFTELRGLIALAFRSRTGGVI